MIVLLTEADQKVATGHLMEMIELAAVLTAEKREAIILINDDCASALLDRIPCHYIFYESNSVGRFESMNRILKDLSPKVLVTDMRELKNDQLSIIKKGISCKVISIDEWGHRKLEADAIVNPMIDPYYWEYETKDETIKYYGAEYLILPQTIQKYRSEKKKTNERVRRICISMGGVDAKGTTIKLVKWLFELMPELELDIILGGGFPFRKEIDNLLETEYKDRKKCLSFNVDNIYEHFLKSDMAFCAGGNTLHELACMGIPAVVVPTEPHEIRNGKEFERRGFGKCLSIADEVTKEETDKAIHELLSYRVREGMHHKGTVIADGKGVQRMMAIINKCEMP